MNFRNRIMSVEDAKAVLAMFANPDGVVKVEDKLGGASHEARLVSKILKNGTPHESAIQYIKDSPADVFVINVTIKGTRGRAKNPVPDRMFAAFYLKSAILEGATKFGPTFTVHTNCVTFHRMGEREVGQTFGLPLCAIECPFTLKDIQGDYSRPQAPYAKFWENFISQTFHGHNVANLLNSKYDMQLVFISE